MQNFRYSSYSHYQSHSDRLPPCPGSSGSDRRLGPQLHSALACACSGIGEERVQEEPVEVADQIGVFIGPELLFDNSLGGKTAIMNKQSFSMLLLYGPTN